jgi:hypothetical protein
VEVAIFLYGLEAARAVGGSGEALIGRGRRSAQPASPLPLGTGGCSAPRLRQLRVGAREGQSRTAAASCEWESVRASSGRPGSESGGSRRVSWRRKKCFCTEGPLRAQARQASGWPGQAASRRPSESA